MTATPSANEQFPISSSRETEDSEEFYDKEPTITARSASPSDIPRMVAIERERYEFNDAVNPRTDAEIYHTFRNRLRVAKDWMLVVEVDGQVEGFTTGMPTFERIDEFESWEKTTNNGTLIGTFMPEGNNVYVVNLDVSRKGTAHDAQFKLMAKLGEKVVREGKDQVVFVSRIPGFTSYIEDIESELGIVWTELTDDEQDQIAHDYTKLTVRKDGKEVLRDRLLRFYDEDGFTIRRLIRDGFNDPESLDYGVLCTGENPVPKRLRDNRLARVLGAGAFRFLAANPKYIDKVIG